MEQLVQYVDVSLDIALTHVVSSASDRVEIGVTAVLEPAGQALDPNRHRRVREFRQSLPVADGSSGWNPMLDPFRFAKARLSFSWPLRSLTMAI